AHFAPVKRNYLGENHFIFWQWDGNIFCRSRWCEAHIVVDELPPYIYKCAEIPAVEMGYRFIAKGIGNGAWTRTSLARHGIVRIRSAITGRDLAEQCNICCAPFK